MMKCDRPGLIRHRRVVQEPTLISLIAQIAQSDSVTERALSGRFVVDQMLSLLTRNEIAIQRHDPVLTRGCDPDSRLPRFA